MGKDAEAHFNRISDIEGHVDVFLHRRILLSRVWLGESDTIETDDQDDETFEFSRLCEHVGSITHIDPDFINFLAEIETLVAISHVVSYL